MYKAFIEPDLNAAQLKIHNSFNPFTGFMNATYILKAKRQEQLTQQAVVAVLGVSERGKCTGFALGCCPCMCHMLFVAAGQLWPPHTCSWVSAR
jgi:hypothetical protein